VKHIFRQDCSAVKRALPEKEGHGKSEHELFLATSYFRRHSTYFKIFLIFLSVAIPLFILYYLYAPSFDKTFNGRAYYLFFVWLIVLEFASDWDKYRSETSKMSMKRTFAFGLALLLPTAYVIVSNFFGFNRAIMDLFRMYGVISPWLDNTPLAVEYLAFAVLFAFIALSAYKLKGLAGFSLSIALLVVIGAIHAINILYPYGGFTPFQILVPTTATLSADVLNLMGYQTTLFLSSGSLTPTLMVRDSTAYFGAQIAWPCAGVESLLLYTIIILLFLKKADIPRLHKIIYFAVGAAVTYFINILRIVTILLIGLNGGDVWTFHDYYGQLYSAIWIMSYPLIIIGTRILWSKYKDAIVNFIVND
jgi:exosortase/archaeosortase family protein